MSHPTYRADTNGYGDVEGRFLIHSGLTVEMTPVRALSESEALTDWLEWEMLGSRLLESRIISEPYRHLEARIDTGTGEYTVHVVRERNLNPNGVPRGDAHA